MSAVPLFVLLDDDEDNRLLIGSALRRAFPGAQLLEPVTVPEAIAAVEGVHIDGVITDHHLADAEGPEFVHALRARGVDCPIIMVTTSSDPRVHRRAYAAGADRVFNDLELLCVPYLRRVLVGDQRS